MARTPLFSYLLRLLNQTNINQNPELFTSYKRRKFLKNIAMTGGSLVTSLALSNYSKTYGKNPPSIAIIGGGIAGLNAAYQLKKVGLIAKIYEGKERLGGRIHSIKIGSKKENTIDLGGSFINSDHEDLLTLAQELGVDVIERNLELPYPNVGYYFKGKVWQEAELANLLNPISQQIAQDAALLSQNFTQYASPLDALSVTQYLDKHRDKISHPVVRNLLENSIRTEYGVEPQNSSALQLINNLPKIENQEVNVLGNSDELYYVSGGTGALINELVKSLNSEQIKTYKQLIKIQSEADKFKLTFQDNSHVLADYVILAIPFTTLRKINIQVSLPDSLKRFIQTVDLGNNEKVFAKLTHAVWQQETGFIKEAWTDLGASEIWESMTSLTPPSEPLLTFFLGGNEATSTLKMTGRVLGDKLIQRLDSVIYGVKEAATGDFWRTAWQNERLIQGAYTNFKPGQYTEFKEWMYIDSENLVESQKVRVGNLIFAGEQFSANYYGYMNGAAETGRLAAEIVIETFSKNVSTQ